MSDVAILFFGFGTIALYLAYQVSRLRGRVEELEREASAAKKKRIEDGIIHAAITHAARSDERGQVGLAILGVVVVVVLVIALAYMAVFGVGFFKRSTADFRGETNVIEKTRANAEFRIEAYDHFFDLCASIQTADQVINATQDELVSTTDPFDVRRLRTNLTGQTADRARAVNQYNADARKSYTSGQFRSADLPYQLPLEHEIGDVTSCG